MNWEQITTWLDQFTNKPLVYWTFVVLVSFGCAFILFSQTSIGKKTLKKLTNLYELGDKRADDTLKKVKEVELLAKEKIEALTAQYEEKAKNLEQAFTTKVSALVSILDYNENRLFSILEKIPNAKVQEELANAKAIYQEKKQEIVDVVGILYDDYETTIELIKEDVRSEYQDKIAYLENQLAQVSLYLNEIKKEEVTDGQGEETINTNPTEEETQSD